jgi:hypothetical protein
MTSKHRRDTWHHSPGERHNTRREKYLKATHDNQQAKRDRRTQLQLGETGEEDTDDGEANVESNGTETPTARAGSQA